MPDWETVREIAGSLPAAEESTSYGQPAFKVAGKLFVWISPNRDAQGALALRVDPEEKEPILESSPEVYFTVPHYDGYPAVLVHLDRIDREELRERIEDAWLLRVPKRLADGLLRGRDSTSP